MDQFFETEIEVLFVFVLLLSKLLPDLYMVRNDENLVDQSYIKAMPPHDLIFFQLKMQF